MIKFLCNECGCDFNSNKEAIERHCPSCKSTAEDHVLMSFSEIDDDKVFVNQEMIWQA